MSSSSSQRRLETLLGHLRRGDQTVDVSVDQTSGHGNVSTSELILHKLN